MAKRGGTVMIVVSGAPGTGKSTMAAALGSGLNLPVLSLDPLKEALADVLGLGDEEWSNRLGDAAAEIIFRLGRQFPSVVVEGWWRGDRRLRARREFKGAVEVFCRCDPDLATQRMRNRHLGRRHAIHRDVINPSLVSEVANATDGASPLLLGAELVVVDTSEPGASVSAVTQVGATLRS